MKVAQDPRLQAVAPGAVPASWGVRAIFRSPAIARVWADRSASSSSPEAFPALIDSYVAVLGRAPQVDTVVSWGPGGTGTDRDILRRAGLSRRMLRPVYVPVDISPALAVAAARQVESDCDVPIAIAGDFEEGMGFILRRIREHRRGATLWSALGNIVGNADLGEANLVAQLAAPMEIGDALLLSFTEGVFTAADLPVESWADLAELLAAGQSFVDGTSYEVARESVLERVRARLGPSDVPGATSVEYWDGGSERRLLVTKRYTLAEFARWLELRYGMRVRATASAPVPSRKIAVATVLCERGSFVRDRTPQA